MASEISDRTRKRLWGHSNNTCAYTGCDQVLLEPTADGVEETVVGDECHIVARRDHPSVARAPCLLTDEEKLRWAHLMERRSDFPNLVLMCRIHARLIDDVNQRYSVEQVVEMKQVHEAEMERRRRAELPDLAETAALPGKAGLPRAPRPIILDDVPGWQRKATAALAETDPEALSWLRERLGTPADAEAVRGLIEGWDPMLDSGPDALLNLLIREAEALALWSTAADVWERLAERHEGNARADLLVRAGIDAEVGGDHERRGRLLSEAEALDPDSPRLRLERLEPTTDPAEQLAALAAIKTTDPALAALMASQRALAHLLLADLDSAEEAADEAHRLDPDSVAARTVRINLEVQRARIALRDDKPFVMARALDTRDDALELREALLAMGRWHESVRLLMLAADIPALLRDPETAQQMLERARPEEIAAEDGAEVLGEAALRVGASELALRVTEDTPATDAIRRIRASALADLPGPARREALAVLEELALGDGPERDHAAMARLIASQRPILAPWNEEVAEVLEGGPHARAVATLRTMSAAFRDPDSALELAADLPDEAWGAEVRLRVAGLKGNPAALRCAAEDFLRFAPDASGRLLAAQALAQAGELAPAGQVATAIAHDPNGPPRVRSDAFNVLMKTLADRDQWNDAQIAWETWRDFSFRELPAPDGRVSAWQVRVAHHHRAIGR